MTPIEALDKLHVTSTGKGRLTVDASALRDDPLYPSEWRVTETSPGVWSHAGSGEQSSLGECLRAIALVYATEETTA